MIEKTGYNEDDYISDYTSFKSKDGTTVPMTIIRKKSVLPSLDSVPSQPILTHLTAYGGFGSSNKPSFTLNDVLLYKNLEGIQVIAHTRGGGELGKEWHDAGKQEKR
jgi:prolyl oligopeptidase